MIKAIVFDLGGVLFTNGTKKFVESISEKFGLEESAVTDVVDGELGSLYREGKISRDDFWMQLCETLHITCDAERYENEWDDGYVLIEGTKEIIFELKDKYRVYYLSDSIGERMKKIQERYGFIGWFDGGVFSHEVGVRKPDPNIYSLVLQKAGVRPDEAIFIDDKESSLIPAEALGMLTILFTSPRELRISLSERDIL